ncbi:hypothetical protein SLEP1_g14023 [Rubroshorea leprosula]|uniref:Uncharacterized protein n=1 Tax=Rubroshorea leprosula TaxID=152421 RepID=A0AAV5IQP2_9ROSI|nr:hypothetical protein SLEP1_g14023 [Rubroshorea leprosula]
MKFTTVVELEPLTASPKHLRLGVDALTGSNILRNFERNIQRTRTRVQLEFSRKKLSFALPKAF